MQVRPCLGSAICVDGEPGGLDGQISQGALERVTDLSAVARPRCPGRQPGVRLHGDVAKQVGPDGRVGPPEIVNQGAGEPYLFHADVSRHLSRRPGEQVRVTACGESRECGQYVEASTVRSATPLAWCLLHVNRLGCPFASLDHLIVAMGAICLDAHGPRHRPAMLIGKAEPETSRRHPKKLCPMRQPIQVHQRRPVFHPAELRLCDPQPPGHHALRQRDPPVVRMAAVRPDHPPQMPLGEGLSHRLVFPEARRHHRWPAQPVPFGGLARRTPAAVVVPGQPSAAPRAVRVGHRRLRPSRLIEPIH